MDYIKSSRDIKLVSKNHRLFCSNVTIVKAENAKGEKENIEISVIAKNLDFWTSKLKFLGYLFHTFRSRSEINSYFWKFYSHVCDRRKIFAKQLAK